MFSEKCQYDELQCSLHACMLICSILVLLFGLISILNIYRRFKKFNFEVVCLIICLISAICQIIEQAWEGYYIFTIINCYTVILTEHCLIFGFNTIVESRKLNISSLKLKETLKDKKKQQENFFHIIVFIEYTCMFTLSVYRTPLPNNVFSFDLSWWVLIINFFFLSMPYIYFGMRVINLMNQSQLQLLKTITDRLSNQDPLSPNISINDVNDDEFQIVESLILKKQQFNKSDENENIDGSLSSKSTDFISLATTQEDIIKDMEKIERIVKQEANNQQYYKEKYKQMWCLIYGFLFFSCQTFVFQIILRFYWKEMFDEKGNMLYVDDTLGALVIFLRNLFELFPFIILCYVFYYVPKKTAEIEIKIGHDIAFDNIRKPSIEVLNEDLKFGQQNSLNSLKMKMAPPLTMTPQFGSTDLEVLFESEQT